jgi:hypothetical protein
VAHFWQELSDLGIMLALICVPLAVGAITIPLGLALAERLRRSRTQSDHDAALVATLNELIGRLAALEHSVDTASIEVERLAGQQRDQAVARRSPPGLTIGSASTSVTPH